MDATNDILYFGGTQLYGLIVSNATAYNLVTGANTFGCAIDATQNLAYHTDTSLNSIVQVNTTSFVKVKIVNSAGSTAYPYGDNGLALNAHTLSIRGIAYDYQQKLLFFADKDLHTIRVINMTSGNITVFAGTTGIAGRVNGPLVLSRLEEPVAIKLDLVYNKAYIIDKCSIRVVDRTTNWMNYLAGNGTCITSTIDGVLATNYRFTSNYKNVAIDNNAHRLFVAEAGM
jgi:hypothetical protein